MYLAKWSDITRGEDFCKLYLDSKENYEEFIKDIAKLKYKQVNFLILGKGIELSQQEMNNIKAKIEVWEIERSEF